MKIYKVKSTEFKGLQHWEMLSDCMDDWCRVNNFNYSYYPDYPSYHDVMNMKTSRINDEHHHNPNKW